MFVQLHWKLNLIIFTWRCIRTTRCQYKVQDNWKHKQNIAECTSCFITMMWLQSVENSYLRSPRLLSLADNCNLIFSIDVHLFFRLVTDIMSCFQIQVLRRLCSHVPCCVVLCALCALSEVGQVVWLPPNNAVSSMKSGIMGLKYRQKTALYWSKGLEGHANGTGVVL